MVAIGKHKDYQYQDDNHPKGALPKWRLIADHGARSAAVERAFFLGRAPKSMHMKMTTENPSLGQGVYLAVHIPDPNRAIFFCAGSKRKSPGATNTGAFLLHPKWS